MMKVLESIIMTLATIGLVCIMFTVWEAHDVYKRLDRMRLSGAVKPDKNDTVNFEKWVEHIYGITCVTPQQISELAGKLLAVGMGFACIGQGIVENASFGVRVAAFLPSIPFFVAALYFNNKNYGK